MSNIIYSDFDISFDIDMSTGDINKLVNRDSIRNSIYRIISLNKLDIPFNISLYTRLKELLFEIPGHTTNAAISTNLIWLCEELEPRVKINDVDIIYDDENNSYTINIKYTILRLNIDDSVSKEFKRVR